MRVVLTANTCFKVANFRASLINALLARDCEVIVLAPIDGYVETLKAMGCRVEGLEMDRNGTSPAREMALLRQIWYFLRREKPDIVFSFTIKNNIYAGICCRWLRIPFIPNVTGLGPAFNGSGWLNRGVVALYRLAFAQARTVFFQNLNDRATFLKAGLVTSKQTQILPGSGVDLARFTPQFAPYDPQKTTFLLVSRLLWDKGVGIFVEAARALRINHPDLRFQILGPPDPDSRSGIEIDQIKAWQDEGTIEYLGQTNDVRPALAAADCLVLPTWYREGTPRTLLEAAAMGIPVITTDTPGCRDVVEAGVTGFLCAPRDRNSLVTAMLSFRNLNDESRAAMRQSSRRRAETFFSEEIVITAYLQQLEEASDGL
jgi:glycosyltransferase involved in cell wall biosynthesis